MFRDSACFLDGDDCLEEDEGVEGIARSTNLGPQHVFTMDGSHCTTFDFHGLYFPISRKCLINRNEESRQNVDRLYTIKTCGGLQV